MMQKNWTEKNVGLAQLTTRIGDFFKEKDFEAIRGKIPTGHQILAEDSSYFKINGCVSVTIEGKPEDFSVKLELLERKRSSFMPTFLTTMLFGGYFLAQRLKSQEDWMKFEKEFWRYVENTILHLTNSTVSSRG